MLAVLSKQGNQFASVHASMLACGGKRQLQPTKVAASTPMRSVLMQSPLGGLSSARNSCCVVMLALVVYLLCKNVNHSLSVRPSPREALAWLMSAQRGSAAGD